MRIGLQQGQIVKSEVNATAQGKRQYHANVLYIYEVEGRSLEGSTLSFGMTMSKQRSEIERLLSEFTVGEKVAVYYHPKDPELIHVL